MSTLGETVRGLLRPSFAWLTLAAALGLTLMGMGAMRAEDAAYATGQQKNLTVALLAMLIVALPHPRLIGHLAYPAFIVSILLLVFLLLPFVPQAIVRPRNGARAWIDLKLMDFQPSEMAKVCYVLSLGWYLRFRENHRTLLGLLPPFFLMLIPVGLIMRQPDMGTAMVFGPTLLVVLVAAGAKLRHLSSLVLIGAFVIVANLMLVVYGPAEWQLLKPYQQRRITSMLKLASGDTSEVQTSAYQQYKAMNLAGSGGVTGYGERTATLLQHYPLPEAHNDMIFAVIVNRWGLLGAWTMLGLYLVVVASLFAVAAMSRDALGRVACVGFAAIFLTQAVINIGMNVGLLPITGITLPFVSHGGSSLLFSYIMVGLALNFASRRAAYMARPSFEFDR